MVFATAALLMVSFLATWRFALNRDTHKLLIKEIARRRMGGQPGDCDTQTRWVIKQLTGYEYDQVWGGNVTRRRAGEITFSDVP